MSGGITFVAGVLNRAGGIAAVVIESVAVVANLARADAAVAADDLSRAGTLFRAVPVGLDLAGAVAPVAGQDVPVVTVLNAILIVLSIAAGLRILGLAARGVGAFASPRATRRAAGRGDAGAEADIPTARSARARLRTSRASLSPAASRAFGVFNPRVAASHCRQGKNHRETGPR